MARVYVALDIETTGLNPERDAIIEIGAVRFRGDKVLDTWSTLVNPGRPLSYRVQQLTGITSDELNRAPSVFSVTTALAGFVRDAPLVGHNIPFDLSFLRRLGLFQENVSIDTFELASILIPYASRYNLATLAQHLGLRLDDAHRALADALCAKDLFLALIDRAAQLDSGVMREIYRLADKTHWPLRHVFADVQAERAKHAFAGGSIGQQLRAKGIRMDGSDRLIYAEGRRVAPLQAGTRRQTVDVEALLGLLAPRGLLARHFPGYEFRPQQAHMLARVAEAFNRGDHLLIEAGTGVGKSLAYLLPAIDYAVRNSLRVVISTNTINLQDQLLQKDIPGIESAIGNEHFGRPFHATVLKGRSNYLCRHRLDVLRRRDDLTVEDARVIAKVLAWLPTTTTGDVAELTLREGEWSVWSKVNSDPEICRPETCPDAATGRCFFNRAKESAEGAHVVVVNHALLLSDLAAESRVLPEYKHLIIDEAHHLEDQATSQLGFEVDRRAVDGLLREISHPLASQRHGGFLAELMSRVRTSTLPEQGKRDVEGRIDQLRQAIELAHSQLDACFDGIDHFIREQRDQAPPGQQGSQVRVTGGLRIQPSWANVEVVWDDTAATLNRVLQELQALYLSLRDPGEAHIPRQDELIVDLSRLLRQLDETTRYLNAILLEPEHNGIYWIDAGGGHEGISLHAAPLHVGPLLHKQLFAAKETVILTSATLRTDNDFSYIRERLGLEEAVEEAVGSPFDYERSTLLYLPTDIPEPGQPGYQRTLERALIELCQAMQGRTLALFTSHSQLQTTYRAISGPLGDAGILVLGQGMDGGRRQLLETFRASGSTVLLGTKSFWEGIDVVGEALSCLAIARLPFDVPTDPVFAARSETFEEPFSQYSVPQAVLRFRQGFGRLIRSASDRGVVAVLDRRLLTKSYGPTFLNSLPACTTHKGPLRALPAMAARWIDQPTIAQQRLPF